MLIYNLTFSVIRTRFCYTSPRHTLLRLQVPTESQSEKNWNPAPIVGKRVMGNMHLLVSDKADVQHMAISVNNVEKNTTWSLFERQ